VTMSVMVILLILPWYSIKTGPNSQSGVLIVEVMPNSSADNAGLKVLLVKESIL